MVYDISHRTLFGSKSFSIRFDELDGFLKVSSVRYLVLFGSGKDDAIDNRLRYLINQKTKNAKIKVDSYNHLPLEKTLML